MKKIFNISITIFTLIFKSVGQANSGFGFFHPVQFQTGRTSFNYFGGPAYAQANSQFRNSPQLQIQIFGNPISNRAQNHAPTSCSFNNGGCQHSCEMIRGHARCFCHSGYYLGSNRFSCYDVDECDSLDKNNCEDVCTNTPGSFRCGCSDGLTLQPDGISCAFHVPQPTLISGQHSCRVNNGGCEQLCESSRRQVTCRCYEGFRLSSDGRTCTQRDPCARENGGCQHICLVENGRKMCACYHGFELAENNRCRQIQVNPCEGKVCYHKCEVINGKAVCVCNQGYVLENGICSLGQPQSNLPSCSSKQSLLPTGCGSSLKNPNFVRIVAGNKSKPSDWPWVAGIMTKNPDQVFCGGTLIKSQFVLTAAHCCNTHSVYEMKIRLGEFDFSRSDDNCPQDFEILNIIMHEEYDYITLENDIALLQMERPVRFNAYIQPLCLPPTNYNPIGKTGFVIGWGSNLFFGKTSDALHEASIKTWDQSRCESAYPKKIVDGMICAGSHDGKSDSCQGDSGGPFMQFFGSRWHLVGIVSWGDGCGMVGRPGVYTQVNKYILWINTHS